MNYQTMSSEDAARVLVYTLDLTADDRDVLVAAVTQSWDAAWVLANAPALTAAQRTALLLAKARRSWGAAQVLVDAPDLTADERAALVARVIDREDAVQVLVNAPNLTAADLAALLRVANQ